MNENNNNNGVITKAELLKIIFVMVFTSTVALIFLLLQNGLQNEKQEEQLADIDIPANFDEFVETTTDGKKEVILYSNFVLDEAITPDNIVKLSRIVKVKGEISSASLNVKASTTDYGFDEDRKHTVYFYIDNGSKGGHLGATKSNNLIVDGYFTINEKNPYNASFDLQDLPISQSPNGATTLNVLEILNDEQPHYIGGFVATGHYGILDEMSIAYECKDDSDCSIELIK